MRAEGAIGFMGELTLDAVDNRQSRSLRTARLSTRGVGFAAAGRPRFTTTSDPMSIRFWGRPRGMPI